MAVVLAGGEGERLSLLSGIRAKPAVPFAGKYRVIDFTLSNCVNSGITSVLVLTQYNPRSLNDHIGAGRPWDLDRNVGGVRIMQPYVARDRPREWYRGTADAVTANIEPIRQSGADIVLVLAGDHIYKMDYGPFIQQHRRKRADVTIAVKPVPIGEAHRFGILALDDQDAGHRMAGEAPPAAERPREPRHLRLLATRALTAGSGRAATTSAATSSRRCSPAGARVYGHRFEGYWQDVGTVHSYWEAHMELLDDHPQLDLYDRDWVIHTRSEERPPARIGPTANVHRSLVSHGCVIAGHGRALGPVAGRPRRPGSHRARQRHHVRHGHPRRRRRRPRHHRQAGQRRAQRGRGHGRRLRRSPNQKEPERLNTGITIVGKRAVIPASARIGRNVRIGEPTSGRPTSRRAGSRAAAASTSRATARAPDVAQRPPRRAEPGRRGARAALTVGPG